jgi:transcriptional regulator with XRE-family HTH domain
VIPYGRLIVAARVLAGWSQAELSAVSGVPERTVRRLEQGDAGASIRAVSAILKALEQRGVEVSGGGGRVRSGLQIIKGTDADRQLEDELGQTATDALSGGASSGTPRSSDDQQSDAEAERDQADHGRPTPRRMVKRS